jgi:signal transduction histidine kinase/DNA-binding response OmpR family regulator
MENGLQKINILLVDDNPANLLTLETVLEAPDRNLVRASSGEEALRYLLDQEAAVILLDVHMPNINGLETAALIRGRERTRNVPIIFLTAHDSAGTSHISQGYSLGAVDYIIKPADPEALKSKVAVFAELYRKTEQVKQQAALLHEKNIELENANLQRLSRLVELGRQLASERDPDALLETFCHQARDIVGAQYAAVITSDDGNQNQLYASGFDREVALGLGLPEIGRSFLEDRFKADKPLRLSRADGVTKKIRFLPEDVLITSFLGAPLLLGGQPRGWLYLANKLGTKRFNEADERLAATLTSQAVAAWENARLYAEAQRYAAHLEQEIAERKQAEKERAALLVREQAARAEAEAANRLKDEFLATVSHELRAPLNAVLGWITLVRNGQLDEENQDRALETIERNARIQKRLIDDLLDVSRIITGKLHLELRPTDLVSVIEASVESVRPAAAAKGVRLQMMFDPTANASQAVQLFQLDPNRLQQVIWNLVSNAVKFTGNGGRVEVCFKHFGEQAEIAVSDTGIGITPEFLPFVFDRFRQADGTITRKYDGLGLGLAIVRHLVEMHGGTVRADSAGQGKGATFTIKLPLVPPSERLGQTGSLASSDRPAPNPSQKLYGLRVLAVDDQPDVRDLLATILQLQGAEVQVANGVAEAMKILDVWRPDVVISDIAMPDGDGYELMRRMRGRGCNIPAISLTAHAGTEDRIRALTAGFQMHLPKPVEPDELVISIANLTGRLLSNSESSVEENPFAQFDLSAGRMAGPSGNR